jgi:cell division inhibitor SepF
VSLWRDLKVRLGLEDDWDDEYYEEDAAGPHESDEDDDEAFAPTRRESSAPPYQSPYGSGAGPGAVKRLDRGPDLDRAGVRVPGGDRNYSSGSSLRSVPAGPASVTPVSANMKMHIVEPKSFTEAQSIADKFKQGTPVIMNMASTSPDLAKRLLDFASGLTYGLDGGLQKVSDRVFMLTPHNIDVTDADRRRMRDTGLFSAE